MLNFPGLYRAPVQFVLLQKQQKYRLGEFIKLTLLPSLQLGLDNIMLRNCIAFS